MLFHWLIFYLYVLHASNSLCIYLSFLYVTNVHLYILYLDLFVKFSVNSSYLTADGSSVMYMYEAELNSMVRP